MGGERRTDGFANMATLDLCLTVMIFICRICTAILNTDALDLEQRFRDTLLPSDSSERGREPGVAMFHQYEDCHFTAVAPHGHILHTLTQDDHIGNFTLKFVAFGKRFLLDFHLTRNLFSSSYIRKVLHKKGTDLKEALHRKEHCYYQGHIRNNPFSHAALSSCDGFRGYISDGNETYHIDSLNGTLHRIFRNSDRKKLPFKCGTQKHDIFHPPPQVFSHHTRRKRSIRGPYDANKFTRYVELYIVNDYRTFGRHGKNATVVFKRSQDIANIVNSLYRQLNMYVVLVGVEVWSTGDKISVTSSADTTMENFLRYRKERINPYHTNDNAQLITGISFDHGVVGKAIKGPICTHQFSGGVSMDYDGLVTLVATTMAHEMGHNFGMEHDNDTKCSCPQDKCIMAATSGQFSPQHWSSCSQNSLHEAFELGMDYCLRNPPTTTFDGPVCGNGLVEDGEECDCGLLQDCTNRCCNASACMLHAQAECATGRCCDLTTCKAKKPATLCREPTGECDLPEFCDGASEFCPPDVSIQDGLTCADGQSYCYKGRCNTHNGQCQLLWGSTGRVSDPICFQQLNLRGNHDGNCGYNWTTDRYQTCERENVMCGLLHCVHLNEKLMFWRDNLALDMRANFLTRGNTQYVCRSTMLDVGLDMPDPGLVPDGAKCEEDKICIKQTCTPLMKLKIAKCPDCNGNGVCNSAGNCHCQVGYAPPLCDRPGYGGSLNSGPATNEYAKRDLLIGLLVLFLVVLPLLTLAFLAYINRQRIIAWWKLGPHIKFGVLKSSTPPPPPPQPRLSTNVSEKRWSSAPPKPHTTLEISGPLLEDPPGYDDFVSGQASAPARPIFKPSANKPSVIAPKLNPPTARHSMSTAPASTVPSVTVVGGDRRTVLSASRTTGPPSAVDGAPNEYPSDNTRVSRVVQLNNVPSQNTLKRQKNQGNKCEDRPTQSPPSSPTKAGKKVLHSQSMSEPKTGEDTLKRNKIVKRESFRGTEISSPILVSTTNRDSQVFADFELDQSGVIARPMGKQQSLHRANLMSEAEDGCRNPVRRSQSDRPLSPKKRDSASDVDKKKPGSVFFPRPLPPEPVDDDEPLYANQGLSDLDDLKAQISSVFEGFGLTSQTTDNDNTDSKTRHATKPATLGSTNAAKAKPLFSSNASKPGSLASSVSSKPGPLSSKPDTSSSLTARPSFSLKPSAPMTTSSTVSKPGNPAFSLSSKPGAPASDTTPKLGAIASLTASKPGPVSKPDTSSTAINKSAMPSKPGPLSSSLSPKPASTSFSLAAKPSNDLGSSSGPKPAGPSTLSSLSSVKSTQPSTKSSVAADNAAPSLGNKSTALERVLNNRIKMPFGTTSETSTPSLGKDMANNRPDSSSTLLNTSAVTKTADAGGKTPSTTSSTPAVRGPFGSALRKGPSLSDSDTKKGVSAPSNKASSEASEGPASVSRTPSTLSTVNKGPTGVNETSKGPASVSRTPSTQTINKGPAVNEASKGPASVSRTPSTLNTINKGPAVNEASKGSVSAAVSRAPSTLNTSNKGPVASSKAPSSSTGKGLTTRTSPTSNKPAPVTKLSTNTGTGLNKGTTSNTAGKLSAPKVAGKDSAASSTAKAPGTLSNSKSQGPGGGSNIHRSSSAASRPAVAPKPGAVKPMRSFNF